MGGERAADRARRDDPGLSRVIGAREHPDRSDGRDDPGLGLSAPAAEIDTLTGTGTETEGRAFDPRLRVGLSGMVTVPLPAASDVSFRWGLFRDQAFCDTCDHGEGPGWLGSELLGSTDLTVAFAHRAPIGGRSELVLRADAVVPASRDALVFNPFYGAPGLGATCALDAAGSVVSVGVSARRPFFRYDAAPIGRCAPPLRGSGTVGTLTGAVAPTPWDSTWFGASNPLAHRARERRVEPDPPARPRRARPPADRSHRRSAVPAEPGRRRHPVDTLSGAVEIAPSGRPVRTVVPWSVEAGWALTSHLDLSFGLSNRLPTVLADPGGTFRALPASTALTAAATGHF